MDEQTRLLSMLIEQTVAARQPDAERHSANEDEVQEQVPQPSSEEHNAKNETEEDQDDEQERHEEHEAAPEIPVLSIRTVNDFFVLNSSCARNEEFVQQMVRVNVGG